MAMLNVFKSEGKKWKFYDLIFQFHFIQLKEIILQDIVNYILIKTKENIIVEEMYVMH